MISYADVAMLVYPEQTVIICGICKEPFCESGSRLRPNPRVDIVRRGFAVDPIGGSPRWGWSYQLTDCGSSSSVRMPVCCVCADRRGPCPLSTWGTHIPGTNWHHACGSGWGRHDTERAMAQYDLESRSRKVAENIEAALGGPRRHR